MNHIRNKKGIPRESEIHAVGISVEPASINTWVIKAYMFGQLGRSGDAEEAVKELARIAPNLRLEHVPGILMIKEATGAQRIVDGLRKVGFSE